MESLIAKLESVQLPASAPIEISSEKLLSLLTETESIKRSYLNDACQYYTKLISDNENIKSAVTYLSNLAVEYDHTLVLEESSDILQCIIVKQQVLDKLPNGPQMLKMMFRDIIWDVCVSTSETLRMVPKSNKATFCAGIMLDDRINVWVKYKSILKRQGYPTVSSFLVKILYNINMCIRLYSKVTFDDMVNTMNVAGTVDVRNVNINWKYKLKTVPRTDDSSDDE